jgi:dihydrodipicolinate synthase/N-acetylneuraminate lyase
MRKLLEAASAHVALPLFLEADCLEFVFEVAGAEGYGSAFEAIHPAVFTELADQFNAFEFAAAAAVVLVVLLASEVGEDVVAFAGERDGPFLIGGDLHGVFVAGST